MTKEEIFVTLGIAALIHESDAAVRKTAKRLIPHATGSFAKSVLRPLAESKEALDIIAEEVLYPQQEQVLGTVWREGYEYDIVVKFRGDLEYDIDQIVNLVSSVLLSRGIVTGRVYLQIRYPRSRHFNTTSIDMKAVSQAALHQVREPVIDDTPQFDFEAELAEVA